MSLTILLILSILATSLGAIYEDGILANVITNYELEVSQKDFSYLDQY